MYAQISQKVKIGFTNRPKGDILNPCEENGTVLTLGLSAVSYTRERHPTTGTRWVSLFFNSLCVYRTAHAILNICAVHSLYCNTL